MDLSREYGIQSVKDCCEAFMLLGEPTVTLFVFAQDYELPNLLKKCIDHFSLKALHKIEEDPDFSKLSEENRMLIFKNQRLTLQDFNLDIARILLKHNDTQR